MKLQILLFLIILSSCNKQNPGLIPNADFSLTMSDTMTKLSYFQNKVSIVNFGYTFCPDICHNSMSHLGKVLKEFKGNELKSISPIFISVDPDRDLPERLKEYTNNFHPSILGITGSKTEIDKTVKSFKSYYKLNKKNKADMAYKVDHSSLFYIINKNGTIVKIFQANAEKEKMVKLIRTLL